MNCWICSAFEANTREHRHKKSDLKSVAGVISDESPAFRQDENQFHQEIRSLDSKKLKFEKTICGRCNSSLTQPYDMAWAELSKRLFDGHLLTDDLSRVWLNDVYGGNWREKSIDLQLFFVKAFGCRSLDKNSSVDLSGLAQNLCRREVCTDFFVWFGKLPKDSAENPFALETPFVVRSDAAIAFDSYCVGRFAVNMVYVRDSQGVLRLPGFWSPYRGSAVVRLHSLA